MTASPVIAYRPDIDGLRALAVVAVVAAHADLGPFAGGFVGVDIFFVISGYLITAIIKRECEAGTFSLARFYERRIRRIVPALAAVLLVTTVAAYLMLPGGELPAYGRSLVATVLFASNFYFWQETDYFAGPAEGKPLLHTWSLAVEEQFYLGWPLLLMALWRFGPRRVGLAAGMLAAGSFVLAAWSAFSLFNATFFLLPTRFWELGVGALLALGVVPALNGRRRREVAAGFGLAMMLAAIVFYSPRTFFPGLAALAPCIGAALVILAGQSGPTRVGGLLSSPPVVGVGLISYSLYLWHWPLLALLRTSVPVEPGVGARVAAVALAMLLAIVTWRYVETPARRRRTGLSFRAIATSCAGAAIVLLIAGGIAGVPRASPAGALAQPPPVRFGVATDACFNLSLARIAEGRPCVLGAVAVAPRVLLWGDSHAEALAPGIDKAARDAGVEVWYGSAGGCPPLIGVARWRARPYCGQFNDAMLGLALTTPAITDVVLAGRWNSYADGWPDRGIGLKSGPEIYVADAQVRWPSRANSVAAMERGLARTVAALRAGGKRVWLVEQVPYAGIDPVKAWRLGLPASSPAARVPRTLHRADVATADRLLARVARDPGVGLIKPADVLCDAVACPILGADGPLYSDDHHLSTLGAEIAARAFADVFRAAP